MRSLNPETASAMRKPTPGMGLLLYAGYLAIFFTTWAINGVDYLRIGESTETTRLWYALPTLFGGAFLVVALTWLGWWRQALFEPARSGPAWVWLLPVVVAGIIVHNFLALHTDRLTAGLLLWAALGAIGVGFGEEMITRGSMVMGLRSRFTEVQVWLFSTLLFSALHVPNVLFGLPLWQMPIQVVLTFIFGSGLYAVRRISGGLILPMVLHGLWDSALFLGVATGATPSLWQYAAYPLAIACVAAVLLHSRKAARAAAHG